VASRSAEAGSTSTRLPSLQEALEAAWERSVAARESDGRRQRAQAEGEVAKSSWAGPPALEISHRNDRLQGHAGQRELEVGVSVPLWLPGQRAATARTAQATSEQAQAAEQAERLHLAAEVREAAWLLSALAAETAQAAAHTLALRQLAEDVERRVRAGDLARADALAAQAEHLAAKAQQVETGLRLQAAQARWTLLTGLATVPDLGLDLPGTASAGASERAELLLEQHPQWVLAQNNSTLARQRLELLRLSNREAPELSLGLRQDTPGRGASSQGSLGVALRLPLATPARNRPLQAQASSELALAETQSQRLRKRLGSEWAQARAALLAEEARLQAETERARLLRQRAALIDKSFRAGETPLPDLLRALHAAAQADGAVARQTAAKGLALARLQQALGLLP
jgi:outer membrane protein TolC